MTDTQNPARSTALDTDQSAAAEKAGPIKWKIGWGVTDQCNMRCAFCYSRKVRDEIDDVPFPQLQDFVDRNHAFIDSINYGTGENTLSKDWQRLLVYTHHTYSIPQALTTNGTLAPLVRSSPDGDEIMACLEEVDVSLDFADPERHCTLRGHDKAYEWALETIKLCRAHDIETTIVVLGIDRTLAMDNLKRIFALAAEHEAFVRINIFRPNASQPLKPLSYRVLQQALRYILEQHAVVSLSDRLFSAIITGQEMRDATGKTSLRILPNGSITPSTYLVSPDWWAAHIGQADLGDQDLSARLLRGMDEETTQVEACQACDLQGICRGGALDRRVIWYGGLQERDPYCPTRHGETVQDWCWSDPITTLPGPQIHDGYLPTLIFSPRSGGG
jgi:radical SAM protein with 4Fe4S-binding SPASM domain